MDRIIKKFINKETVLYIIFGILTTIVNIVVSTVLYKLLKVEGNISSTVGIIIAIIFAYVTNRKIVFDSNAVGFDEIFKEFIKFVIGRAFTMILEIVGVYILFSVIGIEYIISKLLMTIIVIIVNFFISKFFAFKK